MRCDVEVVVSYCCKSRVVQVTCVYFIHYQITQEKVTRRKI
ncbi:AAEL017535-PA [Aedes aegypti]|uniref:AAEL017535-PA n=1 Tax=Aedes aegypti TaxID=7159 RepID=J9HIF4_AEDAE|nr:AAEL017535-PA [Aedes aegypti]